MSRYTGNHCPVCEQKFKDGEDIVVCPDCGTPYHRECWQKIGTCMHSSEHAAGFEWKPDTEPESAEAICPNCGTHNPVGAQFCNHCGVPLPKPGEAPAGQPRQEDGPVYARRPGSEQGPHIDAYGPGADGSIYRRQIGPDDPIDGIRARDWASFVGRSSLYYLMQFFRMSETKRKASVSFSAFFLGPIYFFYRKMWRLGALFTALEMALAVPSVIYMLYLSEAPLLAGVGLGWLPAAMNICYVAEWVLKFVMGLFAVYWYKKEASRRIQAIYAATPEGPGRTDALALQGGTSLAAVLLYLAAALALGFALSFLIGPNWDALVSSFL